MTLATMPRTKLAFFLCPLLSMIGFLMLPNVFADTVVLKNGKKFEGVIKNENSAGVTINIGLGTITFNRAQIASVERSETRAVEEVWQRELITRGKFVPEGLQQLADKLSALESFRNQATRAKAENARIERHRTELFNEISSIQDQITKIAAQFQVIIPENNVQKYNSLVKQQNRLATRAVLIKNTLEEDNEKATSNLEVISAYMKQLEDFEQVIEAEKAAVEKKETNENVALFFANVEQRIKDYATEFQQIEVPHEGAQDHMLVKVRVNDRIDGLFLLDTGATYVTLSSRMAGRLGLGLSRKNNVSVSLANGASVAAQPVILDSMQAGDARVDGVIAMVFPDAPHDGVDGLLGMSFLREFTIQLDPVNKKLVFQKFAPN